MEEPRIHELFVVILMFEFRNVFIRFILYIVPYIIMA